MEEKLSFLWSLAIVTLESLEMLFQKLQRRQQNANQKVSAKERQVFWGTAEVYFTLQPVKFWSNHSGNKVKPIKSTRSQQSRPFAIRSTLAFCERFKNNMKINRRVIK